MTARSTAIVAALSVLLSHNSLAQDAAVPIYRVTVVGRTTPAINYQRRGDTKVDLVGTALIPDARGVANISPKQGHSEIVTAEPYFAVTQPSDLVVMENSVRPDTRGRVETVQAKYELLPRGWYSMNRPSEFATRPPEPGLPLDLAEARNAIELARLAGADQYAADTFAKAARLLAEAEAAGHKGRSSDEVKASARQSSQTAEDARLISVTRQATEFTAQQKALADQRGREALDERLRADREELSAAQARADAEREAQNAVQAKADADRERTDLARVRDELQQARLDALRARPPLLSPSRKRRRCGKSCASS